MNVSSVAFDSAPQLNALSSIHSLACFFNHSTNNLISSITANMHAPSIVTVLAALPAAMACLGYTGGVPKATGSKSLSAPKTLKKGEVFDAGWVRYDRGVKCTGQAEGGKLSLL